MSEKHLWKKPHNVKEDFWWYELNSGIYLYFETHDEYGNGDVKHFNIPWKSIRAALKRKDMI